METLAIAELNYVNEMFEHILDFKEHKLTYVANEFQIVGVMFINKSNLWLLEIF